MDQPIILFNNGPLPRYLEKRTYINGRPFILQHISFFHMGTHFMPSSSSLYSKNQTAFTFITSYSAIHQRKTQFLINNSCPACACKLHQEAKAVDIRKHSVNAKSSKGPIQLSSEEKSDIEDAAKKKGTVGGAVALIIGTSIGSGLLALPKKASAAGFVPSSVCMIVCWGFLLIEALLLVEINVKLRQKKGKEEDEDELEVISIRTMAQETLGDWGGNLATITYVFLGYTSMVAYSSKSGEILFHLINFPESASGCIFTAIFTLLILIGGTQTTDQVNQWLTAAMIGLLVAIEVLAVVFRGWSGLEGSGDWGHVPATIPVMIFSLVYHDIAPVLCAYLGADMKRLRASILIGSFVPLVTLLLWDTVALGLLAQTDQVADPVELLMSVKWYGVSSMVEAFSLLAVGTSLIGTLLGFSEFFKEQLKNLSRNSPRQLMQEPNQQVGLTNWWENNKISFMAMAMAVAPTLFVSTTVPDAFSAATDIAGGYGMTILYGVLPPAMAWAMHSKESEKSSEATLSGARPVLLGLGIFACVIVVEQIFQDFTALNPYLTSIIG